MIAQSFGFTGDYAKEWGDNVYSRLNKILCEFKEQARARSSGENCGLKPAIISWLAGRIIGWKWIIKTVEPMLDEAKGLPYN